MKMSKIKCYFARLSRKLTFWELFEKANQGSVFDPVYRHVVLLCRRLYFGKYRVP